MAILSDLLVGKSEQTTQAGTEDTRQKRAPSPQTMQMFDLLSRGVIGQMARPPETAIPVPTQQAVSMLQGMAPNLANTGSLIGRMTAPPPTYAGTTKDTSWLPGGGAAGGTQQGLQTREQLGLPSRESYFTFMPNAQQVADIGLAPIRPGGPVETQRLFKRQQNLQEQIARRRARGLESPGKQKQLDILKTRVGARTGPSYL